MKLVIAVTLALLAASWAVTARAQIVPTPTTPPQLTGYGTLSVLAASLAISTATVGPNAPAFPTSGLPGRFIEIKNSSASANVLYVCPLGGTCTTAAGYPLALGEVKSWALGAPNGSLVSPTVISAGTATAIVSW